MNDLKIKGNWNQIQGKLKEMYGDVVDDESLFAEGKADQLIGKLQEKTGKSKEALIKEIEAL
jgi:uncharacterized protein YjbJ (UPF0337 family)